MFSRKEGRKLVFSRTATECVAAFADASGSQHHRQERNLEVASDIPQTLVAWMSDGGPRRG
jgi:hypothetical protein